MFAVRREVLEKLLRDRKWCRKLEKAETLREAVQVLVKFAEEKGYKIKAVKEE
jgi:hypothetical protein